MNTTPGTNTNPTAIALADIVRNAETMYNAARCAAPSTQPERDAYRALMAAVRRIADRNGNDFGEIIELSDSPSVSLIKLEREILDH